MTDAFSLPYFHPSTIVFLDDNLKFLSDLEVRLPETMAYVLHHNPTAALAEVNRHAKAATLATRCFSRLDGAADTWRDSTIEFDISLIEEEVTTVDRFSRVSVVVVDYAMPAMDGLEFCARIEDPYVKKVLLTGAADEKLAVRAFNDGLIDRFVLKNQPDSLGLMLKFATEMQIDHFRQQQTILAAALSLNPPPFLKDAALVDELGRLATEHGYVEHYLVGDPPGFLLITAAGRIERLVILSDAEVDRQTDRLAMHGAPQALIRSMRARKTLACLYDSLVGEEPSDYPWDEFAFDTWPIEGSSTWWLSLMPHPPVHIDFDAQEASLDAYLGSLDAA